jgi:hypothetical protein
MNNLVAEAARLHALARIASSVRTDKNPLPVPDAWSWLALAVIIRNTRAA